MTAFSLDCFIHPSDAFSKKIAAALLPLRSTTFDLLSTMAGRLDFHNAVLGLRFTTDLRLTRLCHIRSQKRGTRTSCLA